MISTVVVWLAEHTPKMAGGFARFPTTPSGARAAETFRAKLAADRSVILAEYLTDEPRRDGR